MLGDSGSGIPAGRQSSVNPAHVVQFLERFNKPVSFSSLTTTVRTQYLYNHTAYSKLDHTEIKVLIQGEWQPAWMQSIFAVTPHHQHSSAIMIIIRIFFLFLLLLLSS